jgi:hypothetical protein
MGGVTRELGHIPGGEIIVDNVRLAAGIDTVTVNAAVLRAWMWLSVEARWNLQMSPNWLVTG